jgi:flagellar motility protein MotE (MotC chaperone)
MSNNGYEKFFKEARRSREPISPKEPKMKLRATPEEKLRRELASRIADRRSRAMRKKQAFPVFPAICLTVALASCVLGYLNADAFEDQISKLLSRVEIGVLGKASAAEPAKPADASKPKAVEEKSSPQTVVAKDAKENAAETAAQANSKEMPNVKAWSQEELSFFSKLNDRKRELDLREAELAKLEEELHKRKLELEEKIKQLEVTRSKISETLKTRVASDQEKVDKLVQVYSSMKPQQAAKVIETLNEDLAVEILDKMKKKSAAEVLDMMNAKKARRLSEMLTGYQRSVANAGPDDEKGD